MDLERLWPILRQSAVKSSREFSEEFTFPHYFPYISGGLRSRRPRRRDSDWRKGACM